MHTEGIRDRVHEAGQIYGQALATLDPLWKGRPFLPRRLTKRIAIRLLETCGQAEGALIGVLFSRVHRSSLAEHSLKTGILTAALVRYLGMPRDQQLDATVAALLHHLGHDTRGSFAHSKDACAQRSLMSLLLTPHNATSHLRQVLSAFQHELRYDGEGEPRLDFPVRQHPLSHLVKLTSDVAEMVSTPRPGDRKRVPLHPIQALQYVMEESGTAYHPGLAHALARVIGPAPVGTVVELADDRIVVISTYSASDSEWSATSHPLSDPDEIVHLGSDSENTIVRHRSLVEAWRCVASVPET